MNGGTSGGHFGASKAHWSAADVYKEMAFNGLKAAIQTTNAMVPDNGWLELEYFFPVPLLPFSFFFFCCCVFLLFAFCFYFSPCFFFESFFGFSSSIRFFFHPGLASLAYTRDQPIDFAQSAGHSNLRITLLRSNHHR